MVVRDDLERSRLTVFFRLLLGIPHYIWLSFWTLGAILAAVANWFATLALGKSPDLLHNFLSAYVRYVTHVSAYLFLAGNPFPGFAGDPGSYPIDVEIDPPAAQNRWITGFRLFLALPAVLLASVLIGGASAGRGNGYQAGGVAATIAFLAWFACLVRGRMPLGFRDALAYALRYSAQVDAYLFLLTDRYPDSDPVLPRPTAPTPRPAVRLELTDDLRRSRLTVFFRGLLALPHLVWLVLWGVAAFFAAIANWLVTVVRARPSDPLWRFLSAYLRYWAHVNAFLYLVTNLFPGFTGTPGSYPLDLEYDPPERQSRWTAGFRLLLAVPALLVAGALGGGLLLAGVFGWFFALATSRMPRGLRNLGAYAIRYSAETYAYVLVLSGRYPFSGPNLAEAGQASVGPGAEPSSGVFTEG